MKVKGRGADKLEQGVLGKGGAQPEPPECSEDEGRVVAHAARATREHDASLHGIDRGLPHTCLYARDDPDQ